MTKVEIVKEISTQTGLDKDAVLAIVEATMENIKANMAKGENIYLRGFGTFLLKKEPRRLVEILVWEQQLIFLHI